MLSLVWLKKMNGHLLEYKMEHSVFAFSGGLVGNHHLSVSDDLLSGMLENHVLHHLFKLSVSFKSSQDGERAQRERKWKLDTSVLIGLCVILENLRTA